MTTQSDKAPGTEIRLEDGRIRQRLSNLTMQSDKSRGIDNSFWVKKIYVSFILFTKQDLSICTLLERFSGVTTFSGATYFLGITTSPAIFSYLEAGYLDSLASVFPTVYAADTLTCSRGFSGFLRPSSSDGKGSKDTDRGAYIEAARIGSTCTRDTCSRDACIGNTFAREACTRSACIGSAYIGNTSI